jgi:RNA polymerase sigma-70 factor (ECF subfamily)
MESTHPSLLEQLRQPGNQRAWERFARLYTPLLLKWARRLGLWRQDASDLVQEVFLVLIRKLPEFDYDQHKSFRAWLRTVVLNKWHDGLRRRSVPARCDSNLLSQLPGPDGGEVFEKGEYEQELVSRAMKIIRADFHPTTWQAFQEHGVQGRPAAEVAAELGLRAGAVYSARFRVMDRMRQVLQGLLD